MKKTRPIYDALSAVIIGKKLQSARTKHRYTQKQIGDVLGVSSQQVQKYESGTNSISIEKLAIFAEFLGFDIGHFLSDEFASEMKHKEQAAGYIVEDCGVDNIDKDQESYELFSLFSKHLTPEQAKLLTSFIKSLDRNKS